MKPLLFALALVALATCGHAQTNYCDPVLCRTKGPHIACNGLATLAADCGPGGIEKPLDAAQQALVLDLHNRLRSKVASGQQNYSSSVFYPSAARMATLRWDNELAAIAAANVRRCQYGHDKCRNTPQYSNAGQNIANLAFQNTNYVDSDVIRDFINDWYSEYAVANPALMASYPKGYTGPLLVTLPRSCRTGVRPWVARWFGTWTAMGGPTRTWCATMPSPRLRASRSTWPVPLARSVPPDAIQSTRDCATRRRRSSRNRKLTSCIKHP